MEATFLAQNFVPIMFGGLLVLLLTGFPVAFALAACGLGFGWRQSLPPSSSAMKFWREEHVAKMAGRMLGQEECVPSTSNQRAACDACSTPLSTRRRPSSISDTIDINKQDEYKAFAPMHY